MAIVRSWKHTSEMDGPHAVRNADIPALNDVFSDAFTERYHRDGMVGVRVPHLNPAIWRFAVRDAGGGAQLWRGPRDEIAAFNIAHCSGVEGWMGPLAVRPQYQGSGIGKTIVRSGVDWLRARGAQVIGLETMPRTMDNIGFYSGLGFVPSRLTLTVTADAIATERPAPLLGRLPERERDDVVAQCAVLTASQIAGYDFTREIRLTEELALGDTVLLWEKQTLAGFALCHTAPLVEGRVREELRVLKLVLSDAGSLQRMIPQLCDFARRSGTRRVALRVQGEYATAYQQLVALGGRVRWSDLRMTLAGYEEARASSGIVLSNWEI